MLDRIENEVIEALAAGLGQRYVDVAAAHRYRRRHEPPAQSATVAVPAAARLRHDGRVGDTHTARRRLVAAATGDGYRPGL
ncbi:MAG: hypothetical protein NVSMB55_11820 [Mycobacteriales bacterium]